MYYHVSEIGLYPSRKYAYTIDGDLEYQGFGKVGAKPDEPVWAIMKYSYDSNKNLLTTKMVKMDTTLSDTSDLYQFIWNNRESYDYE